LGAGVVLFVLLAQAAGPTEELQRGKYAYDRGEFNRAVEIVHPLLYPDLRLQTENQIVQAHRILGVSYLFEKRQDQATGEFRKLLQLSPDYRFDPLLDPPEVVDFFNKVRADYSAELAQLGVTDNIIMTQVVPLPDSNLPIVREARSALGTDFGFVSLEGYIVGKMTLRLLQDTPEPLTPEGFASQARQAHFDLGGLALDFRHSGDQASDLVVVSQLSGSDYREAGNAQWKQMLAWRPGRSGAGH